MGLIERFKNLSTPAKVLTGVVGVAVVGVAGAALVGSGVVGGVATAATAAAGVLLKGGNSQGKESLYTPGRKPIAVSSDSVPDDCRGEYRILDSQNDVKYVGVVASENRSLQDRIREHQRTRMFDPEYGDRVQYLKAQPDATKEQIYAHEKESIAKHNPYMNKCNGGNGPR